MTCYLCDGPGEANGSPPVCLSCCRAHFPGLMAPVPFDAEASGIDRGSPPGNGPCPDLFPAYGPRCIPVQGVRGQWHWVDRDLLRGQ